MTRWTERQVTIIKYKESNVFFVVQFHLVRTYICRKCQ